MRSRIILATEGKKTERNYISAIRRARRLSGGIVDLLRHQCTDPLSLVRQAVCERESRRASKDWEDQDEAWVVFDVDEHRQADPAAFDRATQLAAREDIRLAPSNPAFELWLLIHFQVHMANLDRHAARRLLKNHLPNYDKTLTDSEIAVLLPRVPAAIKNAQALEAQALRHNPNDPFYNPITLFGRLVERIQVL